MWLSLVSYATPTNNEEKNILRFGECYNLQLNGYETDPYFLQFFQSNTTFCLITHLFCKNYEPEIALKKSKQYTTQENKQKLFQVHKSCKRCESTLLCSIGNSEVNIDLSHIYLAVCTSSLLNHKTEIASLFHIFL